MLQFMRSQRVGHDLATEQQQRSAWISSFLTFLSNITPTSPPPSLPPSTFSHCLHFSNMTWPSSHFSLLFSTRCCSSDSGYFYSTHTHTHTHTHSTSKALCCSLFLFGSHHLVFRYQINSHSSGSSNPERHQKHSFYCSLKCN